VALQAQHLVGGVPIDITFKIGCFIACTAYLACLVSTVTGSCIKHSEKQVLVAGTKQTKQAERAVRAA
jgi:hypothetical protein